MISIELRAIKKFLFKKGLKSNGIFDEIENIIIAGTIGVKSVEKWGHPFRLGRTSIEDEPPSGRPTTPTTKENIDEIFSLIDGDQKITIEKITVPTGLSMGIVHHIFKDILGLKKLVARWVPKILRDSEKREKVATSKMNLLMLRNEGLNFLTGSSRQMNVGFMIMTLQLHENRKNG